MIKRKRIGDILVEAGLITDDELKSALEEQKGSGEKLGKILIRNGILTEDELLDGLSEQLLIARYDADHYPLNASFCDIVPHAIAQRAGVVPLQKKGTVLLLAMTNPTDIDALELVERHTKLTVEPVICTESELDQLMSALYGATGAFDELMETIETPEFDSDSAREETVHEVQPDVLTDMAEGAPAVRMVNWLINQAIRLRASDIHLGPEKDRVLLRFRIDGKLQDMPSPPKALFMSIVSRIKLLAGMDIAISRIPQDGRFSVRISDREYNMRVSAVPAIYGENLVLRVLDTSAGPKNLTELGIQDEMLKTITRLTHRPWGMILVCGPTGSGKTTTLYAVLQTLNRPDVNIMTLEDPAEYHLAHIRQIQINHRAGMSFAQGLRALLRQDPDILMVGEIRDLETAQIAVQAALTGHLVLSTLHTNDAVGAVVRLIDMGVPPFLVGSVLLMVVAQRLVRRVCRECAQPSAPPTDEMCRWLGVTADTSANYQRGQGCNACMNTGYRGRVGLYETLEFDEEIRARISQGVATDELRKGAARRGLLRTLREDAAQKVLAGLTTPEEAASSVLF